MVFNLECFEIPFHIDHFHVIVLKIRLVFLLVGWHNMWDIQWLCDLVANNFRQVSVCHTSILYINGQIKINFICYCHCTRADPFWQIRMTKKTCTHQIQAVIIKPVSVLVAVSVSRSYQTILRNIRFWVSDIFKVPNIQYCITDSALAGMVKYFHTSML